MQKLIQLVLVVIVLMITGCCFDLTHVKYVPVVIEIKTPSKSVWMLTEKIDVPLKSWSTTKLKPSTKWEYIGTIEQGEVYKTKDQIVTVRGSNTFEAYLVISEEQIVGFYLPIEKGFVKISKPIKINRDAVN